MTINGLCQQCKYLIPDECRFFICDKNMHKDYKLITECKEFKKV
jgi:hypothetical protein